MSGSNQYFGYQDNLGVLKWQVRVDLYHSIGLLRFTQDCKRIVAFSQSVPYWMVVVLSAADGSMIHAFKTNTSLIKEPSSEIAATLSPNDILYLALPYTVFSDPYPHPTIENETVRDVYYHCQVILFDKVDSPGGPMTNAVILDQNITSPTPKALDYSSLDNALIIAWTSNSQIF